MEYMRCKKDGYTCACIPWTTREREKEEGSKDEKKKKRKKGRCLWDPLNSGALSVCPSGVTYGCWESDHTPGNEARGGSGMGDNNFLFSSPLVKQKETRATARWQVPSLCLHECSCAVWYLYLSSTIKICLRDSKNTHTLG